MTPPASPGRRIFALALAASTWLLAQLAALGQDFHPQGATAGSSSSAASLVQATAAYSPAEAIPYVAPGIADGGQAYVVPDDPQSGGWFDAHGCPEGCYGTDELWYHAGGKARGYYINDQRIEFTGQEATFVAEGVIDGGVHHRAGDWEVLAEGEFFLNQPFDRNVLVDTPERASWAANFEIEPFEISQLYVGARHDDWYAALGRFDTPFGRYYYPIFRNNFDDSPFIRSEAIRYRETGALVQWDPSWYVFTAALTNGGYQQDTNSSKALVARAGIDHESFAIGSSVKVQDGIGSESQKTFNEHFGLDAMVRRGAWTLSSEIIYDQYGLRRPGTRLNDIFWGRSLYFRDLNDGLHEPITGVGWYVNLGYEGPFWSLMLNYGQFHPESIGHAAHDTVVRRTVLKASRHWTRHFETYGVVLLENDVEEAFDSSSRKGVYVLCGGQFSL